MRIKRVIGLLVALVGIILLAASFIEQIKSTIKLPDTLSDTMLTIVGGILVVLGIILLIRKGAPSMKNAEVPIYQGKDVVGYRKL